MKKMLFLIVSGLLLGACSNTSADESDRLLISAASSLSVAMQAVEKGFREQYPEADLVFNYGSSSKLRNQLQHGAPADLFLSASEKDMDQLVKENIVIEETVYNFAQNKLVLASAGKLPSEDLNGILTDGDMLIAVGEPESVPLGFYTKETLIGLGLWGLIEDKLIYAKDARQVLSYVESGNAEVGFVYSSDARISSKVKTVVNVPENGQHIIYPAAIVGNSDNKQAAEAFLDYLLSDTGQQIMRDYGFASAKGDMH